MSATCLARADPIHTLWDFCPSTPAAILFTALFALTTCAHASQAIFYKKTYCLVIVGSGLIQTLNFTFRIISIDNPKILAYYTAWFVLVLIAPLFTNAFVYMMMGVLLEFFVGSSVAPLALWNVTVTLLICLSGRMVWNFIPDARLYRITAWNFSTLFVTVDIIALIIQIAGAASSAGNTSPNQQVLNAIHIYMAGVGFQQFFILVFSFFVIKFHRTILQQAQRGVEGVSRALPLLYAVYAVLILITIRIVFRLCEYAQGFQSSIPTHEAYQYCLDSLPMLCSLVILNVFHPGRIMAGEGNDLPSRKQRKLEGISNKLEKLNVNSRLTV